MAIFDSMKINTSGLNLERIKLDVISSNIANANTTRTADGGPYLSKSVTFEERLKNVQSVPMNQMEINREGDQRRTNPAHQLGRIPSAGPGGRQSFGVQSTGIVENEENLKVVFDPNHPDADEEGYVNYPNVDMADEMIDLMNTIRSYEANVTAVEASKAMLKKALEISR